MSKRRRRPDEQAAFEAALRASGLVIGTNGRLLQPGSLEYERALKHLVGSVSPWELIPGTRRPLRASKNTKTRKQKPPSGKESDVSEALRLTYASREPQFEKKREITAALYAVARECGWVVGEFHWRSYPMSFHWAEITQGDRKFAFLIEESSPVVALSSTIPRYFNLAFFDDRSFDEAARRIQAPFLIFTASELAKALSEADRAFVARLSAQHERALRYWNPDTIGDVIFNWWD